eukprot:GHVL01022661.1.p1 GENE.GHVL01022661.1~~GHVL01022661.1.p1  ORF type:complete len:624 (+),score=79.58 GHVL01022661.1:150-2021(+)
MNMSSNEVSTDYQFRTPHRVKCDFSGTTQSTVSTTGSIMLMNGGVSEECLNKTNEATCKILESPEESDHKGININSTKESLDYLNSQNSDCKCLCHILDNIATCENSEHNDIQTTYLQVAPPTRRESAVTGTIWPRRNGSSQNVATLPNGIAGTVPAPVNDYQHSFVPITNQNAHRDQSVSQRDKFPVSRSQFSASNGFMHTHCLPTTSSSVAAGLSPHCMSLSGCANPPEQQQLNCQFENNNSSSAPYPPIVGRYGVPVMQHSVSQMPGGCQDFSIQARQSNHPALRLLLPAPSNSNISVVKQQKHHSISNQFDAQLCRNSSPRMNSSNNQYTQNELSNTHFFHEDERIRQDVTNYQESAHPNDVNSISSNSHDSLIDQPNDSDQIFFSEYGGRTRSLPMSLSPCSQSETTFQYDHNGGDLTTQWPTSTGSSFFMDEESPEDVSKSYWHPINTDLSTISGTNSRECNSFIDSRHLPSNCQTFIPQTILIDAKVNYARMMQQEYKHLAHQDSTTCSNYSASQGETRSNRSTSLDYDENQNCLTLPADSFVVDKSQPAWGSTLSSEPIAASEQHEASMFDEWCGQRHIHQHHFVESNEDAVSFIDSNDASSIAAHIVSELYINY